MQGKINKEEYLLLAKIAQQTQRFQQMVQYVQKIIKADPQLTNVERNIVSAAYKNIIGNKRAQLRAISSLQPKYSLQSKQLKWIRNYKSIIQTELIKHCQNIIKLLDQYLLPFVKSIDSKVFYLKMSADYHRYLCQINSHQLEQHRNKAKLAYHEADSYARNNLASTNAIRLSLNLNMAVFYYQIQEEHQRALQISNRAFEQGIANIDNVNQQNYKDCTLILQLLRDNITLWSNNLQDQSQDF